MDTVRSYSPGSRAIGGSRELSQNKTSKTAVLVAGRQLSTCKVGSKPSWLARSVTPPVAVPLSSNRPAPSLTVVSPTSGPSTTATTAPCSSRPALSEIKPRMWLCADPGRKGFGAVGDSLPPHPATRNMDPVRPIAVWQIIRMVLARYRRAHLTIGEPRRESPSTRARHRNACLRCSVARSGRCESRTAVQDAVRCADAARARRRSRPSMPGRSPPAR